MEQRINVKALGESGLVDLAERLGEPSYRGRQLLNWLYGRRATSFEEMTSLPKTLRERLADKAALPTIEQVELHTSSDGTAKALFRLPSGRHVESVLIPDVQPDGTARRLTVCVSSQVGCAMGCTFCATGQMGFQENLTCGEIYDQVAGMDRLAEERYGRGISNVVFMGMGEPLLNYDAVLESVRCLTHEKGMGLSPRRITISTVGLARRIRQLADQQAEEHAVRTRLAVSLHAPTDPQRSAIMPVNRAAATDLTALKDALQHFARQTGETITYEYCLFAGQNDADEDAKRLADVVAWAPSKVNILLYNPVPGLPFERTPEARVHGFLQTLVARGVTVTVRQSRGQDIAAACGQLLVEEGA